jgi:hypothetical protein
VEQPVAAVTGGAAALLRLSKKGGLVMVVVNEERVREMARQFPENGMKRLLQEPANVSDLLALAGLSWRERIDLKRLVVDPTTYVSADFRHVASDLVLTAPLRPAKKGKRRRALWLTILLEHQSKPDRLMVLRVLDYLVQIWKKQARDWEQKHGALASVQLHPILPVVFYTGLHPWERIGGLRDLMPQEYRDLVEETPEFEPRFVNLPEATVDELNGAGRFGALLRLVQRRQASGAAFRELVQEVVGHLEAGGKEERGRWLELLSDLHALVYHERPQREHRELEQLIEASVRTDEHRQEVSVVRKTIAQAWREQWQSEARVQEAAETLIQQLRLRFGDLPAGVEQTVQATRDHNRLREWLHRFATASSLGDVGIGPTP